MRKLFNLVYDILVFLSNITGFSYKEVNIIIWFMIIPLSWAFLMDKIVNCHYFKITLLIIICLTLIIIDNFSQFSNSLFNKSANFLRSFDVIGSNYTTASVIVCIFVPILIYFILIKRAYFKKAE